MNAPISARRDGSNKLVSVGPDVCWTPVGDDMVPVAYHSVALLDPADRTGKVVRNNGLPDFQLNSRALVTTGHEPGEGKGVFVEGYTTVSFAAEGSTVVYSEGWAVIRDGDLAFLNRPDLGSVESRRVYSKETIEHY